MANSRLRTRIHFLVGIAGIAVSCFGVLILASGIMIDVNLADLSKHRSVYDTANNVTCQYWAGIPTVLAGAVVVLSAVSTKSYPCLKYFSICCILITMVVTVGVIFEEAGQHSNLRADIHSSCKLKYYNWGNNFEKCAKLKEANSWYYTLLFTVAVVLALCVFVLLVLIADWILFVALKALQNEQMAAQLPPYMYEDANAENRAPTVQDQQMWNAQYHSDQSVVPLLRV